MGGLYLGGAYTWRGLFSEFYGITTQKFLLEKKQIIGSSVKDGNKLKRVLDFMHAFLHCLSSQNYKAKLEPAM